MKRCSPYRTILATAFVSLTVATAAHAATITVNTTGDGSVPNVCTLRSAVESANTGTSVDGCATGSASTDIINFDPALTGSTITLSGGQMTITNDVFINGPLLGSPDGITIDGNDASRIFLVDGADAVYLNGLTLTRGRTTSGSGGAVRVLNADLWLTNVRVTDSSASPGDGGGLFVINGDVNLFSTTVSGNQSDGFGSFGGGLWVHGNTTLHNSTVSGNSTGGKTTRGGGMYIHQGNVMVTNSTISGNSAGPNISSGGGLYVNSGDATLIHSTVAHNTAAEGADSIHMDSNAGSLTLWNSLVVQEGASEVACSEAATGLSNSLATDSSCTGVATDAAAIALEPLGDNGGLMKTHALAAASVAIDGASDCTTLGIHSDQRSFPRPGLGSDQCDLGAYEFQADAVFSDRFEN